MTDKAPTRKVKTPAVRALEQVTILRRRLDKIKAQESALDVQTRALAVEHEAVSKRLDYAKANPDLPAPANLKQQAPPP